MLKNLTLIFVLMTSFSSVFAATYTLPANIGSNPFNRCSGSGSDYSCNGSINLPEDTIIILTSDVTLNITGNFSAGEDFVVQGNGFSLNLNASNDVTFSSNAVFTGNITAGDDIRIGEDSTITGNLTAADNLTLDQDTVVNGICSPTHPQCTGVTTTPTAGCETLGDNFNSVSYSNQDGTINWSSNWVETNDNSSPNGGEIRITGNRLRIENSNRIITRNGDLSAYATATISFDYQESSFDDNNDYIDVEVQGGGNGWTSLQTFAGSNVGSGTANLTIPGSFLSNDFQIRFITSNNLGSSDRFYVDNLRIEACGASGLAPGMDFHFDEQVWSGVANEVIDSSASANHASINAGSGVNTISLGQVCRAGQFDGIDDYLISNDIFSALRSTASMSFWIKTTQTGNDTNWLAPGVAGIEQPGGGDDIFWGWLDATGHIGISKWDTPSAKSSVAINDGMFHHVVLTRESSSGAYKIYIDGVLDTTGTTGAGDVGTSFSSIGRIEDTGGTPEYLEADLDEIMVFNSILSDAEVAGIYTNQLAGNNYDGSSRVCIDSPLVEWHFDEPSWSGTSGEVVDSQGTLNATAVNGANTGGSNPAIAGNPGTCRYGTFDGTDDYVDLSGMPELSGSFTISAWIYANEIGNDQRIFADDQNNSNGFAFSLGDPGDGRLRFFSRSVNPTSADTQNSVIVAGRWHHVAAVHDAAAMTRQIYVDGTAVTLTGGVTAQSYTGTWGVDPGAASIGGENNSAGSEAVPNWRFNGNIDEVRVYVSALSASQINSVMNLTRPCAASGVDHFNINIGAGSASTCAAFGFTITAEDSSNNPVTDYSGTISIATSTSNGNFSTVTASNNISPNPDNDDNGSAGYTFDPADNGSISLALSNEHAQTLTISVVDSLLPSTLSTSTDVIFSDNAFVLSDADTTLAGADNIPVAGRAHNYRVQMIRRDPTDPDPNNVCAIATGYNGDKSLKMWRSKNPADPSNNQPTLGGNPLPDADPVTANGVITFVQGEATLQLQTTDIGRYTINLADISNTYADVTIAGTSIEQIIRPFGIGIDFGANLRDADFADNGNIDGSGADISYADSANGTLFTQAGEDFTTLISGVLWASEDDSNDDGIPDSNAYLGNNSVAPSFGQEGETVTIAASNPRPGSLGTLSGTWFNNFVNGAQSQITTYSNVGLFDMSATITDGDYFGSGMNLIGSAINVGRFNPHHYRVIAGMVNDACAVSAAPFSYARQAFSVDLTVAAQGKGNNITDGYRGSYVTLPALIPLDIQNSATAVAYDSQTFTQTESFSAGTLGQAQYEIELTWDMAQQAPTTSTVEVIQANDEVVTVSASPVSIGSTEVRFGRLAMDNVFGSELIGLTMPMRTQYFDGNNFIINIDDGCTTVDHNVVNELGVTPVLSGGSSTVTVVSTTATAGILDVSLTAPGADNTGYIDVVPNLTISGEPWLQFDWDGDGNHDNNPTGRASFGIYSGDSRQIYYRQIYQ